MGGIDYNEADELDPDHVVRRGATDYSGLRVLAESSGEDIEVNGDDSASAAPIVLLAGHLLKFEDENGVFGAIGVSEGTAATPSGMADFYAPDFGTDPRAGLTNVVGASPFLWNGTKKQLYPNAVDGTQRIVMPAGQSDHEDITFIARLYNDTDYSGGQSNRRLIVLLKYIDANNYLYARYDYNQPYWEWRKVDGGVDSLIDHSATDGGVTLPAYNQNGYTLAKIVGNVITIQQYSVVTTPANGTSPRNNATPTGTATYTLTGANATKFGAGVAGKAGFGYQGTNPGFPSFRDVTISAVEAAVAGTPTRMTIYDDNQGTYTICGSDLTSAFG